MAHRNPRNPSLSRYSEICLPGGVQAGKYTKKKKCMSTVISNNLYITVNGGQYLPKSTMLSSRYHGIVSVFLCIGKSKNLGSVKQAQCRDT